MNAPSTHAATDQPRQLKRLLGPLDATMIVAGLILASLIALDLLVAEKTQANALPGLLIVLTGIPVYWLWRRKQKRGEAPAGF